MHVEENEIENATRCYANPFGEKESIFVISNDTQIKNYIEYHRSPSKFKYLPFSLNTIEHNQEVLILDTLRNDSLFEIKYFSKNNAYSSALSWKEALIYYEYLDDCQLN